MNICRLPFSKKVMNLFEKFEYRVVLINLRVLICEIMCLNKVVVGKRRQEVSIKRTASHGRHRRYNG